MSDGISLMIATSEPMPDQSEVFRQNLLRLRLERGWTKAELARRAGLSESGIGRWERGERKKVSWANVIALAKALEVDPDELVRGEPETRGTTPEATAQIPAGIVDAGELLRIYVASPWYIADQPTPEEMQWLASLGGLLWTRERPNAETVHALLEQRRAGIL